MRRTVFIVASLLFATPFAQAQTAASALEAPPAAADPRALPGPVAAALATAPAGTRFGLLVVDDAGKVVAALDPDKRFIPASNTKLFTTAAGFALLPEAAADKGVAGAGVALVASGAKEPDAVLVGFGDAYLSAAPDCADNCLSTLADVIAARTRVVHDVVGDATYFPDQRWSPGMSWNNIGTDDGTAIAALSLADNALALEVAPSFEGLPPRLPVPGYFTLTNLGNTALSGETTVSLEQAVNRRTLVLHGQIPSGAKPARFAIGIDDPAEWTAWNLAEMLKARGVKVTGTVVARYRAMTPAEAKRQTGAAAFAPPPLLARLTPPALVDEIGKINKDSSNVHAELLLRRIGRLHGVGSLADGIGEMTDLLVGAGVPRAGFDFSDGSGMSTYNRVSPAAAVALLRWAEAQPWGAQYKASLPVGGTDGTLRRRFARSPLAGKIQAKTGTLNATNALSGYMTGASGKRLVFSIFANDVPDGGSAVPAMDAAIQAIAAAN